MAENLPNASSPLTVPVINTCLRYLGLTLRKHVFRHMWTAKAQISLRIRAVWSGPSLSAKRISEYYRMFQWRAKCPDETLRMCRMVCIPTFCACSKTCFDAANLHYKNDLRRLNILSKSSDTFTRRDGGRVVGWWGGWWITFCGFLFAFMHAKSLLKRDLLWQEKTASKESKKFTIKVNPLSEGRQNVFNLVPPPLPPPEREFIHWRSQNGIIITHSKEKSWKKNIKISPEMLPNRGYS